MFSERRPIRPTSSTPNCDGLKITAAGTRTAWTWSCPLGRPTPVRGIRGKLREELAALIPEEHRKFVRRVLEENGIPTRPIDAPFKFTGNLMFTGAENLPMIEIILAYPGCKLFVSALGSPPPDVLRRFHDADVKVGALAGNVQHAVRHVQRGVDVIVAQGTEAGGHTGEISTMVLTPDVVDAVAPVPVLAAGGIGTGRQIAACLALGAKGAWTGSIWLTVIEAATTRKNEPR